MKKLTKVTLLTAVFALAIAAPASAHHVDAAASSADCTKVSAKYVGFSSSDKPVSEKIIVDGNVVYTKSGFTWSGSDYTHIINYPSPLSPGAHTVVFVATWATQGTNNATFTKQVSCASTSKVNAAVSTADCSKVSVKYESFVAADLPVSEKITVDGTVVYNKSGFTWSGSSTTRTINYPTALTPGTHTVVFSASWATRGTNTNTFTRQVLCASTSKVNTAASTADCAKVSVKYDSFVLADLPITEKITVDGTAVYNKSGFTFLGSGTTHEINYPTALSPGDHTIVFTASWATLGANPNTFTVRAYCAPPPVSFGCDGEVVDVDYPAAVCPGEPVPFPMVEPQGIICRSEGRLVLYTRHSKILAQRLYVNGKMVASNHPNANSYITKFALPDEGDHYSLRIVARLRSQRTGRKFRWVKTVKVKRCGVAVARTLHIDP